MEAQRWLTDDDGHRWAVERVGRTSGRVPTKASGKPHLEPADIIRFTCTSEPEEPLREMLTRGGVLEHLTPSQLKFLFDICPIGTRI